MSKPTAKVVLFMLATAASILGACASVLGFPDRLLEDPSDGAGGDSEVSTAADAGTSADGDAGDASKDAAPSAVVVAATMQHTPTRIALDKNAVYWRSAGEPTEAGAPLGEILKLSRTNGAVPVQLVTGIVGGAAMNIDVDYVYWGSGEGCGAPTGVRRIHKTGSMVVDGLVTGCLYNNVTELVVDGADLFFLFAGDQGPARARPPAAPSTLAPGIAQSIAVDKGSVYFGQPATATLARIDKGDAGSVVSVFAASQRVVALVTDDTAVYWVTEQNTVARLDRDKPGAAPTVLAKDQPSPTAIALTATHVLWTNAGDGTVRRVAKAGGTVETLASEQEDPAAIAADEVGIYWLDRSAGTVMRIGL